MINATMEKYSKKKKKKDIISIHLVPMGYLGLFNVLYEC